MTNIASVSLAIGYPTIVSAPHSIINGFKNLLAIAAATEVSFKEAETMKELLSDPEKMAALAAAAAAAPAAGGGAAAAGAKKEEAKKVLILTVAVLRHCCKLVLWIWLVITWYMVVFLWWRHARLARLSTYRI